MTTEEHPIRTYWKTSRPGDLSGYWFDALGWVAYYFAQLEWASYLIIDALEADEKTREDKKDKGYFNRSKFAAALIAQHAASEPQLAADWASFWNEACSLNGMRNNVLHNRLTKDLLADEAVGPDDGIRLVKEQGHLHKDKEKRVELQTRIMELLKRHARLGICLSFDMNLCPMLSQVELPGIPNVDHYTLCCYWALIRIAAEAEKAQMKEDIHYFFEAGNSNQKSANRMLESVFNVVRQKVRYRYAGHKFVEKEEAVGVQAADILAWQWATDRRRQRQNLPSRKDLVSLAEGIPHDQCHFNEALLKGTIRGFRRANRMAELVPRSLLWSRWRVLANGQVAELPALPIM